MHKLQLNRNQESLSFDPFHICLKSFLIGGVKDFYFLSFNYVPRGGVGYEEGGHKLTPLGTRERFGTRGGRQCRHRTGGCRQVRAVPFSSLPPTQGTHGCHSDLPSGLKRVLLNARSVKNKPILTYDLFTDE